MPIRSHLSSRSGHALLASLVLPGGCSDLIERAASVTPRQCP